MSYSIVYDRLFIKSARGITPCVLSGDNNVWEGDKAHQRRARDWSIFYNKPGTTEEELMKAIKPSLGGYQEHWKSNGKWVDDEGLKRWIHSGCAKAMTVEDIIRLNPRFRLGIPCKVTTYTADTPYGTWGTALDTRVKTTEEFDRWIDDVVAFTAEKVTPTRSCYPHINFGELSLTKSKKEYASDTPVLVKHQKQYLVMMEPGLRGGYTYRFSSDLANAMVLPYNEAERIVSDLSGITIVDAKVKQKYDPHVVVFSDGSFLSNQTGRCIYTTRYENRAKRYASKSAAERAIKTYAIQHMCDSRSISARVQKWEDTAGITLAQAAAGAASSLA